MGILGQLTDVVGTALNFPEWNISEKLNGGQNTVNTQNYQYAQGNNPYSTRTPSWNPTQTSGPGGSPTTWNTVGSNGYLVPAQSSQPTQQKSSGPTAPQGITDKDAWARANGYTGWNDYQDQQNRNNGGGVDYSAQIRNDINSGYDNYFGQLDSMMSDLPNQAKTQNDIVQNNYQQGVSDLNSQKESSLADLNTQSRKNSDQQVSNLRDIADNIGNLMRTGQVMLGTRGAGDSSAANMYSYALTKQGSKQRADVLSQTRSIENDIADRSAKLNNIVTQQSQALKTNADNAVLSISQWLAEQQGALKQAKANGELQKGQSLASLSSQLLQTATQALMNAKADYSNRRTQLETWAMNNSKTIDSLKSNLQQVSSYLTPQVQASSINGIPSFDAQGNMSASFYPGNGYGSTNTKEKTPQYLSQLSNYVG